MIFIRAIRFIRPIRVSLCAKIGDMKSRQFIYYFIAFLLALGLRFIGLGAVPLTDKEAKLALQALAIANGENPLLNGQPGYILLTSIPFYLFESTNFLARFFPALAGSLLVFVPYFFFESPLPNLPPKGEGTVLSPFGGERREGANIAIITAFLLAIAPGLVAVSRQASGTMFIITFGLLACAMWKDEKPQLAGIFAGIALLGGTSVWLGLLIASLTWAIGQALLPEEETDITETDETQERPVTDNLKLATIYAGGTLLLIGTLFFQSPNGLSALFSSLVEFLNGWRFSSGVSISQIFGGLVAYYPLALLFSSIAVVRGIIERNRASLTLSLWALVGLLLVTFYPSHQVSDLVWVALPLWVLSAHEISRHLYIPIFDRNETLGVFALTILLLAFAWLNISGASSVAATGAVLTNRLILLGGSLLLLVVSLVMIAIGWSLETAVLGGVWGTAFMLGLYTLSAAWGSSGLRTPKGIELWDNAPRVTQAGLLVDTADSVLKRAQQTAQTPTITVYEIESPALLWALRNFDVNVVNTLSLEEAPEIVITAVGEEFGLSSAYRGQDFIWREMPNWAIAHAARWLVLREIPMQNEELILWGRSDLFFDSQN